VTTEQHAAAPEHPESNIVSLTKAQVDAVGIATGGIEQKDIAATIKVTGTLAVPAQNKASVSSLYSGVIRSIHVHPGAAVRKGQLIATITNTELSGIQQQLISVNADLKLAELEQKRQQELVAGNAAPVKNLQRAEAALSGLGAQRAALQKQLDALGISAASVSTGNISSTLRITAPISGTISDIHAQIGSNVDIATPLAEIVNNSQLHLDLFVYEKDLPAIRTGQIIHFTLTNNPGREYDARIFSVGTAFANESKAIPVHAEVEGDKTGLIEGMSVTALVSIGSKTSPAVPAEAVVSANGKDYIFIRTDKQPPADPPGHESGDVHAPEATINFRRVEVARGISDLGYTEIIPVGELPAGAAVVVKGAFFLMAKMTNTGEHE
jgi:RND family efflux transporter MFP subunit